MENPTNLIESAFLHHWVILTSFIVLVIYHQASKKIPKLPSLPTKLLILYLLLKFISISLPPGVEPKVFIFLSVGAIAAIYCAAARILFSLIVETWYRLRKHTGVPKITRDLILFISYATILLIVLRTRGGVNLMGLITTSAVLTAVIGFAAQNALGNLLAGLTIQTEHPFRIGEWLQVGEHTGKVISIGWESTRLLTFDDELIIIPNLEVSKSIIKNHSQPTIMHAMKIEVGVSYTTTPNTIRQVLLDICKYDRFIRKNPSPVVRLINFGDFAITYQIRFFYDDFAISSDLRAEVMDKIWYSFKRNGINIPYPIRDVAHRHIERRFEEKVMADTRAEFESMLRKVPILEPLTPEAKELLAKKVAIKQYGNGEKIVKQGDAGNSLYIIQSGSCSVEISVGDKPAVKVTVLTPPAFFGEMSLLTGEPRSATVRSIGDTTVFMINKDLFKDVLIAHPEISEKLAATIAKRQSETAGTAEKIKGDEEKQASHILSKIRVFFEL